MSDLAKFGKGDAVRGGIPICFPQFGPRGPLAQHGFCRRSDDWKITKEEVLPNGDVRTVLTLTDSEETRKSAWPHKFVLDYEVVLGAGTLTTGLIFKNAGEEDVQFTCALHSYFPVGDVDETTVQGLKGVEYEDSTAGGKVCMEEGEAVTFKGEVDRVYGPAPQVLKVVDGKLGRAIRIAKDPTFPDAVVWNPWADKCRALADMPDEAFRRFVCVEVGAVRTPVTVPAGGTWTARQVLTCERA